jgi:hypothetical protein
MPADGSNAPANIPAAQVRPAVQLLAGPTSTALVFDATTQEGVDAAARFFGGLCAPAPKPRDPVKARASLASLCGEEFVAGLERGGFRPWERV